MALTSIALRGSVRLNLRAYEVQKLVTIYVASLPFQGKPSYYSHAPLVSPTPRHGIAIALGSIYMLKYMYMC